ncbi:MAG: VCBS repeat-containing protein [Nanoarchaeota archaeon]|nr:VCBS repeat-containing protein [Nanoarchaeota archaeon]
MKKSLLICLVFCLMFFWFVSASNVGLIENETWQGNLTGSVSANSAVLGDVDGDGDLDMISIGCTESVCTSSDADKSYVWINNGTSFVENITWEQNLSNAAGSIALGDIDNDGDLDLALSWIGTRIYINNGTSFQENLTWESLLMNSTTLADSKSITFGDIDGDGDLDLLFPDMGIPNRVVWINNGTTFVNSTIWGQEITNGGGKISTGLIDFDNDGDLDLNIAGVDSAKTYINNGTSFIYTPTWTASGGDEVNVAWGDLENDGDFDNVVSRGSRFRVLVNNGSTFLDGSPWETEMSFIIWGSMMLGDYDNNGYLDLVNAGLSGSDQIQIGENNGTTFVRDVTAEANLTGVRKGSVLWGDIDNDGDLDLVSIKSQKVYINNITTPNVAPTPPTSFSSSYNNREMALGWLNGSDNETSVNGLYYNLKLGTASNNHSIISGIYGGSGDATRGGTAFGYFGNMMQRKNFTLKVDRLKPSTTYYWSVQTIDTGLKAGNWSTAQSFTTSADLDRPNVTLNSPVDNANLSSYTVTFNVTVSDNLNLTNVSLWGDWKDGVWSRKQINTSGLNNTYYIFTETINRKQSFQWYIEACDNSTNCQNSSTRTFTTDLIVGLIESPQWQSNLTASNYHNGAVLGDIDGDGDLDMISIGCDSGSSVCSVADKSYVWINNGTSFVENITWEQNLSGVGTGSIALGDIDNDGDLDMIFAGGGVGINFGVYINNGTTFLENLTWQNEGVLDDVGSDSVALGDIDGDGDLDILFPDMGSTKASVYINNGTSFVGDLIWSDEIDSGGKISTGLIDLDNDGDLDLNVHGASTSYSYKNNGTAFVRYPNWTIGPKDEANVVWGDIDNDGDLDQIVSGTSIPRYFINKISSVDQFVDESSSWNFDLSNIGWGSMMMGDYDNNGYLDLINAGDDQIEIGENNGSVFARDGTAEANLTGVRKGSVLWGDIDNDGDLDLVSIKSQKVYINNITTPNVAPTPPTSFSSSYNNREMSLGWLNGSDNETSVNGLYYNLKLGTASNNHSIISGIYGGSGDATRGGTAFGYFGNMMQRKNFTLKVDRLEPSTTYYWSVQTIDTGLKAGNFSTVQSFTTSADLERPNVTLNSPVDNANFSSYSITFNTTVSDNSNLTNVSLWGDWTGSFVINETNTSGLNNSEYIFTKDLTGFGDGTYIWRIEATDNETNVQNSSIRTFTIDTTPPNVSIVSPVNNANSSDTGLDINYTVSDSLVGLDSCWYSNDTYSVNTTITCGTNITTLTWSEGFHNITVWANDSVGNENSSSIDFTIDITIPVVNMLTLNHTNTTDTGLDINYTATDTFLDSCWYSNDTYSVNTSISCGINITTLTWSEGLHNVTIWANDSAGNEGQNLTLFTIDTTSPVFDNPRNFTVNINDSFSQNFTATDSAVEIDTYSLNDTSVFNVSQTGLITNITNLSTMTIYWLNISVNDTLGNLNSTVFFINITSDFDSPNVTLISPANSQSYTSNSQEIIFSYNVTDVSDITNCSLIIDGSISLTNSSITKDVNQNFTQTFTPATYTWNVNCTDALLNLGNSSSRSFTVTAPVTAPSGDSGDGSPSGTPSFWSNTFVVSDEEFKQEQGYVKELSKKQRIKISVSDEIHYVGIIDLTDTTATINITSDPIQIILSVGEDAKLDVLNDSFYDIYVLLNSIENEKANLTIKSIHEEIPEGKGNVETSGNVTGGGIGGLDEEEIIEGEKKKWTLGIIWIIVALIIIFVFVGIKFKVWKKWDIN